MSCFLCLFQLCFSPPMPSHSVHMCCRCLVYTQLVLHTDSCRLYDYPIFRGLNSNREIYSKGKTLFQDLHNFDSFPNQVCDCAACQLKVSELSYITSLSSYKCVFSFASMLSSNCSPITFIHSCIMHGRIFNNSQDTGDYGS